MAQNTTDSVKNVSDFGEGAAGSAKRWKAELTAAKKWRKRFITSAEKTVRRYLDERDAINTADRRFNVLWANVQTLMPATYTHPPKPEVERRFDSNDQVQRVAAILMEHNLEYLVKEHSIYDEVMKAVVQDRLIAGQGTAWVRYEANIPAAPELVTPPGAGPAPTPSGEGLQQQLYAEAPSHTGTMQPNAPTNTDAAATTTVTDDTGYSIPTGEKVCYDYVHWKDFECSPARTWEEVTWVARRVFLTQAQGVARFGDIFKSVPLNYKPKEEKSGNKEFGPGQTVVSKAVVWEIWSKEDKAVYWLADDYDQILDEKPDIFRLTDFYPCPKPLLATTTTDSIVPVPDFLMYQDQAYELDQLTNRISLLTQAVKVIGVYDKSQTNIQRLLTEGVDNVMIPVDNWAMFAEKGGLKGTVDFFPVELVMNVLTALIQARATVKQDVYEITGLSDIVRGSSVASETATAQNIKAKFANVRLSDMQRDVARFASDLVNMTAQLITNFFQPETILLNADFSLDPQANPDLQYAQGAIQLIKDGRLIKRRINVSVDAITDPDQEAEKKARVEFLQAMGMFMQQAMPVVEKTPALAPMMGQMIMFGVRGFQAGRDLEGVIQNGLTQLANQPPPEKPKDPAQQKVEAELELAKQEGQIELEKAKQQGMIDQEKAQQELAQSQAENQQKLQHQQREYDLKLMYMEKEFMLKYGIAVKEMEMKQEEHAQDAAMKADVHQQQQVQQALSFEQSQEQAAQTNEGKDDD